MSMAKCQHPPSKLRTLYRERPRPARGKEPRAYECGECGAFLPYA